MCPACCLGNDVHRQDACRAFVYSTKVYVWNSGPSRAAMITMLDLRAPHRRLLVLKHIITELRLSHGGVTRIPQTASDVAQRVELLSD